MDQYAMIYNLLLQSDIKTLYNICQINKEANTINKDITFWKHKMLKDFGYIPTKIDSDLEIINPDYKYDRLLYQELLRANKMANDILILNEHEFTRSSNKSEGYIIINVSYLTHNFLSLRDLVPSIFYNLGQSQLTYSEDKYNELFIILTYINHNKYNICYELHDVYLCNDDYLNTDIDLNLVRIILTKIVHDINTGHEGDKIICADSNGYTFIFNDLYEPKDDYNYNIRRGMWEAMNM